MINQIHTIIADVLARRSLDGRTCYTSVYAKPPGASAVVFECSEPTVLHEVSRRVEGLAADGSSVRCVLLPDSAAGLPELFVTMSSVADVRKAPSHTSELLTQVISGDTVVPLKSEGDWNLVRLDDGYVGWMRSWHLKATTPSETERFASNAAHRISGNVIQIFDQPDEAAAPVGDAVIGTLVQAEPAGKRGWRAVTFGDGRSGYVRARNLEAVPAGHRISRDRLAATGMRFMGIPYLWGGTTPKGFDCSGLIQRVFRLHGLLVPRDSDLQARFGRPKTTGRADTLHTGDLLFFGAGDDQITHVAMYLSDGLFLHAYGQVRVGALDPSHPLFEGKLVRGWRRTTDPISH